MVLRGRKYRIYTWLCAIAQAQISYILFSLTYTVVVCTMDDEVLRQALVRQWHVLPKFIKRMHIEKITVGENRDLFFQDGGSDAEYHLVDIFAIADISKDFNSRYPKIKNSYAIDPIMALEHVLEDRSSVPEILDVLIYPSFKVR